MLEVLPLIYSDILKSNRAPALLAEYSDECSIPEIGKPNPRADLYAQMESNGFMHCFGVFANKELIGFETILLYVLPHYGRKIASVESLFVAKSHRAGGSGLLLMRAVEEAAATSGCAAMIYSAPAGGQLEKLLSLRKNCRLTNAVFTRKLQ